MAKDEKIQFHYLTKNFSLTDRESLKTFLHYLIHLEGRKIHHVNYIFCSDQYLLQLNQQNLKHNTYTDIITFQFSLEGQALVSDIYISTDRVRKNAKIYKTSFKEELHRVIFHGALHLCGYEDKTLQQADEMRKTENSYLNKYFVSRVTKVKS